MGNRKTRINETILDDAQRHKYDRELRKHREMPPDKVNNLRNKIHKMLGVRLTNDQMASLFELVIQERIIFRFRADLKAFNVQYVQACADLCHKMVTEDVAPK